MLGLPQSHGQLKKKNGTPALRKVVKKFVLDNYDVECKILHVVWTYMLFNECIQLFHFEATINGRYQRTSEDITRHCVQSVAGETAISTGH